MKKTSLRWKTVNILFALVALAFAIGLVLCAVFSTHYFVRLKQESLVHVYETLNEEGPEGDVEEEVFAICEEEGITLLVKDYSGMVVYSFGHSQTLSRRLDDITFGVGDQRGGREIIEVTPNYTLQSISQGEHGANSYVEIWGFLDNGNSFVAQSSMQSIRSNTRISLAFFAIVCAIILVLSAVAIYFIIGYYSKPLARIAMTAQKMNEGDFAGASYEYRHFRQDEIGVLGESVREMGEKLERNIAELKTSNLNLENELKAKTELEEARKKYMSDVSHELKTPIALIAGYAEGLKEGIFESKEDQDYYCDVIIDEAEKMNVIIKRLSTLNQLEEGKSAVSLERFNVVDVINGFLNTMSVIIEDKNASIFFDNRRTVWVWSDEFLFEEVLVNYFNNALNHLDENRIIRINVEKMEEKEDKVRVTVFNSGENIPEEELDQIWGKFYKVDKARTREYGGSGLGLSIVKAVSESLHQECGVYNLSDGVAFWIDLEAAAPSADDELPEEHSVRLKLSELPIWKKTAEKQQARKQKKEKEKKENREEKKSREDKKKEKKETKEEKNREDKKHREDRKKEKKETREEKNREDKKHREDKKKEKKETKEEKNKEDKKHKEEKKNKKKEKKNAADSE